MPATKYSKIELKNEHCLILILFFVHIRIPTTLDSNQIRKEKRSPQTCSVCANHGLTILKKGHKKHCEFESCNCNMCFGTFGRRKSSAHEKKYNYHATKKFVNNQNNLKNGVRNPQECRKCKNHGERINTSGHKKFCPRQHCPCEKCKMTDQRKNFGKIEARNARLKSKSQTSPQKFEQDIEEFTEYEYFSDNSSSLSPNFSLPNDLNNYPLSPSSYSTSSYGSANSDDSVNLFAGIYETLEPNNTLPSLNMTFHNEQIFNTEIANEVYARELFSQLNKRPILQDLKNYTNFLNY